MIYPFVDFSLPQNAKHSAVIVKERFRGRKVIVSRSALLGLVLFKWIFLMFYDLQPTRACEVGLKDACLCKIRVHLHNAPYADILQYGQSS